MAKFRATLRVFDLSGDDPAAAQRTLEERLKGAGIGRHRILSIEDEAVAKRRKAIGRLPALPPRVQQPPRTDAGGLLLVTAVAWVVFMLYYVLE